MIQPAWLNEWADIAQIAEVLMPGLAFGAGYLYHKLRHGRKEEE